MCPAFFNCPAGRPSLHGGINGITKQNLTQLLLGVESPLTKYFIGIINYLEMSRFVGLFCIESLT